MIQKIVENEIHLFSLKKKRMEFYRLQQFDHLPCYPSLVSKVGQEKGKTDPA